MKDSILLEPSESTVKMMELDDKEMDDADEDLAGNLELPSKKKHKQRGNWTGRYDFILSLVGYSIGLGNVWRFPYLVYKNGGGAFLIPFTIMMILCGLPLLFLELALGQFASHGPVIIYDYFCPILKGLGYAMVLVSFIVSLYYNVLIAWTLHYMIDSISSRLPWEDCDPSWRSAACFSPKAYSDCQKLNGSYVNHTCIFRGLTEAEKLWLNTSSSIKPVTPSQDFFSRRVLGQTSGIEEIGGIQWQVAFWLFFSWFTVCLCLSRGVKSMGKAAYFTALFPYVVLIILFIRGITLDGAMLGISYYLTPDWSRLLKPDIWNDAAVQVFFALSPAWGGLITLASYNKFNNNCLNDSIIVVLTSTLTSFFAGFVIFSVIGYLATEMGQPVESVVAKGTGLAFVVYPEIVVRLPISPLWSFLFFFMLLTLGMGTQFALLETTQSAILDRFPSLRRKRILVLNIVCLFSFLTGLIYTTGSGIYWLDLLDQYAASYSVLLIALIEVIYFAWFYGANRFLKNIEMMIGSLSDRMKLFWTIIWCFATPFTLIFILVFNWIRRSPARSGDHYNYPEWADNFGLTVSFIPIMLFLISVILKVVNGIFRKPASIELSEYLFQPKLILTRNDNTTPVNEMIGDDLSIGGIIAEIK